MSSRTENRKRERSWERDDRDRDRYSRGGRSGNGSYRGEGRRRSSRSGSPHRGGHDRRGAGSFLNIGRMYALIYFFTEKRDRDYRRDRPDDRRGDTRGDRDHERDRRGDDRRRDRVDDRREPPRRDDRGVPVREDRKLRDSEVKVHAPSKPEAVSTGRIYLHFTHLLSFQPVFSDSPKATLSLQSRPELDPDAPDPSNEDGEAMDDTNDDDAAMMAIMGLSNFGSTKVCRW